MLFLLAWMNPSLYWIHSSKPFDFLIRLDGEYYRGLFWIGHRFGLYMDGFDAVHLSSVMDAGLRKGYLTAFIRRYGEDCFSGPCNAFSTYVLSAGIYRDDDLIWVGLGDGEDMRYWMGYSGKVWAFNLDLKLYADGSLRRFRPVLSIFLLNVLGVDFPALVSDTGFTYSIRAGASSGFQYDSSVVYLEYGSVPSVRYFSTFSKPVGSFVNMVLYRGSGGNYVLIEGEVVLDRGFVGTGLDAAGLFPLGFRDSVASHQVYPFVFARYGGFSIRGGYRVSRAPYLSPWLLRAGVDFSTGVVFSSFSLESVSGEWRGVIGLRWRGLALYYSYYRTTSKSFDRPSGGHRVGFAITLR